MKQKRQSEERQVHGKGGELHQTAAGDVPILTTQQGTPVSDDQNSLRIGARGPAALEDFHFREKIFHFDHERIPERVVHARGYGTHGYFENYGPLSDITSADLFQRKDLKPSKALRIVRNPPHTFAGRKVGALVTDGVDRSLLDALKKELEGEGATLEIIAPTVGGVEASGGTRIEADQKIGGGPSVLYDAVAVLPPEEGTKLLVKNAAAGDFVADAFTHLKFIAYVSAAVPLFEKAGIAGDLDNGCIHFTEAKDAAAFVAACRNLRLWEREKVVTS